MVMLEKTEMVTLERSVLLEVLKKLSHAVPGKSSLPILEAIKIDVSKDFIVFTATDNDNIIVSRIKNENNFSLPSFVINFKMLFNFLKKSKATFISFEQKDRNQLIEIKASNINYKLTTFEVEKFPSIPKQNFEMLTVNATDFKNAMRNTTFAVAKSESRPVLTGINITYNQDGLQFIGCDSHRLARYKLDQHVNREGEIVVNAIGKSLEKFTKLITKNTSGIAVGFSQNYTLLSFDDTEYYIRNIEGNYPNTSRLIPENLDLELTMINKDKLLEALSTLELITKDLRNNIVKLEIEESSSYETILSSESKGISKMSAAIDTIGFNGKSFKVSFSGLFLKESINALNCNDIKFSFNDSLKPFIITSKHDKNALHLILPVKTV